MKKYILLIIVLLLFGATNISIYTEDMLEEELIEIISPEISSEGKVVVDDSLYISLYKNTDTDLTLNIIKKSKPININKNKVLPLKVKEEEIEEKVLFSEDSNKVYESETRIDIIFAYELAIKDVEFLSYEYKKALKDYNDLISQEDEELKNTDRYKEEVNYFNGIESLYYESLKNYYQLRKKYESLFEKVILQNQMIKVDPLFPYFEYQLDDISEGEYDIIIKDTDNNIIKKVSFEIVSKKVIIRDIMKNNNIFDSLIKEDVFE